MASCDTCAYNVYDDEDECYYCEVDMDEDDAVRMSQGHYKECPYYRNGDEYADQYQQRGYCNSQDNHNRAENRL